MTTIASMNDTAKSEEKEKEKGKEKEKNSVHLYYRAGDTPSPIKAILFGFQQLMVSASGQLVAPYIISTTACAGAATAFIRVRLISTTLVISGIATLLQNILGVRLALLQGPSFAYFPPIYAFSELPDFKCNTSSNDVVPEEEYLLRLRIVFNFYFLLCVATMQGGLVGSSIIQMLIGLTGLIGLITRYIGPLTIAPLMLLLSLSNVKVCIEYSEKHWVSLVQVAVLLLVVFYLAEIQVPIPTIEKRRLRWIKSPIFTLFPYLFAIGFCWLLCFILTITNAQPEGSPARTDKNDTMAVLREAPWLRVPYPGQWGHLGFHTGVFLGFVAAVISSVIESVGAFHACARISDERPPPAHAVNRGIVIEGLGCLISGLMGGGVGVTTYSENIGVINITKVASRMTLQITGVLLIILGVFTKFGAVLATIPEPLVGGILSVSCSIVGGVGLSSLQLVNLKMSRNIAILGFAIMAGMLIPLYIERNPLNTGVKEIDQTLNIMLAIRMFVGGFIGFVLDNTVPGATRRERGLHVECDESNSDDQVIDAYSFSPFVNRILGKINIVTRYVPFLPNVKR